MAKYSEKIPQVYWPSRGNQYALRSKKLSHYRWNFW